MEELQVMQKAFSSKLIFKEIIDWLTIIETARFEMISSSIRKRMRTTHLDIYLNVKVQCSDFNDFENLLSFLQWYG